MSMRGWLAAGVAVLLAMPAAAQGPVAAAEVGGQGIARQPAGASALAQPPVAAATLPTAGDWAAQNARLWVVPAPAAAPATDGFARFGTAMKYALPVAAAICAADQRRLEDFAVRGLVQTGVVWGLKRVLGEAPIGRRPSGEGGGFPSGHTAAAFFGAADLSGKCWPDNPAAGATALSAAALTGASRIHAGEHTVPQVLTGAGIGLGFGGASFGIGGADAGFSLGMRF